jgi:hypothetical protein
MVQGGKEKVPQNSAEVGEGASTTFSARPQSSLGHVTPNEFVAERQALDPACSDFLLLRFLCLELVECVIMMVRTN